ncbi:MAG: Wzz/FepE/Etk N-terminal domain-containing protein [Pseudomonadota bacterium]
MKNNALQDSSPIYIQGTTYLSDNDVSLVDLANILVDKRKIISLIFLIFLILGAAATLLISKKYTYSISIEIGSQVINDSFQNFEPPESLLAKLQHSFIPQVLNDYRTSHLDDGKKYKIDGSIPTNSNIIVLEANGTAIQAELLSKLLQQTTNKAIGDHNRIYLSLKNNLTSRLNDLRSKLSNLGTDDNHIAEKTMIQHNIDSFSSQLANLRNTREMSPPMKSFETTNIHSVLILFIASFFGLFIGILGAFFSEFISKLKPQL